jgi:FtsH-binding integral membrane protein
MDRKFEPVMPGRQTQLSPLPADTPRPSGDTVVLPISQNTVLRNTYWLLALSLLPSIVGAFAGMELGLARWYMTSPIMAPLLMLGVLIGSLFVVTRLRNSGWGVVALFGFTFIAGLTLAPTLTYAAGLRNGWQLVGLAAGMTATIFFALAAIATFTKKDFSFLGQFLYAGAILLLVAFVIALFFPVPALVLTLSAIAVLIFSAFILFDLSRIIHGGETNYIMATMALFLDLFNIFINLLNLLMAFSGQRD